MYSANSAFNEGIGFGHESDYVLLYRDIIELSDIAHLLFLFYWNFQNEKYANVLDYIFFQIVYTVCHLTKNSKSFRKTVLSNSPVISILKLTS